MGFNQRFKDLEIGDRVFIHGKRFEIINKRTDGTFVVYAPFSEKILRG